MGFSFDVLAARRRGSPPRCRRSPASWPGRRVRSWFSSGISRRQGPHQVAQKFTISGWPLPLAQRALACRRGRPVRTAAGRPESSAAAARRRCGWLGASSGAVTAAAAAGESPRRRPAACRCARKPSAAAMPTTSTTTDSALLQRHPPDPSRYCARQCLLHQRREFLGLHEADHAVLPALRAVRAVEGDGRRAEDAEVLEQRLVDRHRSR